MIKNLIKYSLNYKMSQLYALLYKNAVIMSKQKGSSLMMLIVPILCLLMALSLQLLAKSLSLKHKIDPPFDLPLGGVYPINLPYQNEKVNDLGVQTCLRMNKYGFTASSKPEDETFVNINVKFTSTDSKRAFNCKAASAGNVQSPDFKKTPSKTSDETNTEILKQMEVLYDSDLSAIQQSYTPTEGFYLFESANKNSIKATIQSNNFVNFLYHHQSLQTSIYLKGIPVVLLDKSSN
jgi:hypothetical protein